ncbi:MAG: hypothetical protein ACO3LH_05665 [Steroidobacteraceae bacterium]
MAYVSKLTFDEIRDACEGFYKRDGFVSWATVASAFGVTRQAIQLRVKTALNKGMLDQETYDRWLSISSRHALTRGRQTAAQEASKATITITLTPSNLKWIRVEAELRHATPSDIINGLINKERGK